MCGVTGFLALGARSGHAELDTVLRSMSDAVTHRGPDDSGEWRDAEAGIWLGFRRLSILDLSEAGHQPMVSACGRYVLVFNGEIYNHLEIRRELGAGHDGAWRGHADSETLLAAFSRWGIKAALTRTVGMFAFAVWDRRDPRTHACARSPWRKAALLRLAGRQLPFRIRTESVEGTPGLRRGHRSRRADVAAAAQLHPCAALDIRRHPQVAAGNDAPGIGECQGSALRIILVGAPCGGIGSPEHRSRAARRKRSTRSNRCSETRSASRWWQTYRLAHFFPAASTRLRSWR